MREATTKKWSKRKSRINEIREEAVSVAWWCLNKKGLNLLREEKEVKCAINQL